MIYNKTSYIILLYMTMIISCYVIYCMFISANAYLDA